MWDMFGSVASISLVLPSLMRVCSCVSLTVWQDCFLFFCFVDFDGYEQYGRGSGCA
jgi:hypothetical protein